MITESMERVRKAIAHTPRDYWFECRMMRSFYARAAGSYYMFTPEELDGILRRAQWEPYEHPEIQEPAVGFRAEVPGVMGLVELASLPEEALLLLEDPKETGALSTVYEVPGARRVEFPNLASFTVILLGPSRSDPEVEQVWTFHPGDPIRPSELSAADYARLAVSPKMGCTVEWARAQGFDYAKLRFTP